MTDSKIYLNVPFQEKDAAKALGARWDAAQKKWYAPATKDLTLFAKWQPGDPNPELSANTGKPKTRSSSAKNSDSSSITAAGVTTYPADKNFMAYAGDEPPWL